MMAASARSSRGSIVIPSCQFRALDGEASGG